MAEGYRPSVARLYDPADGKQHGFDKFAGDNCLLIFKTEGPDRISKATGDGIDELCLASDSCTKVDSQLIADWFNNLNWGPEKIAAEREHIKKTMNMGYTTEVSGNWDHINEIYEKALARIKKDFPHFKDLTLLGCHSSHSYQTGTNLYFVYDYNVVDCEPTEEINKYHIPLNGLIVEETLKAGGSMVHHHGVGKYRTPWIRDEHGSAYRLLDGLKKQFDPNGVMNFGTLFSTD
jgi:FAD/FMN-containing dehydrogenase